ncbi:MAG TPA: transposase [Telluria sp.]|nr:transposase [Telluria sp.]
MSRYRRAVAGSTFFFTLVTFRRRPILCDDAIRFALRRAIQNVRSTHPFAIDAWVLLPDHLHCIWTMPDKDSNFSRRWMSIKQRVSIECRNYRVEALLAPSRRKHHESTIWQRRFWEHQIRDERDFERHMEYVHFNPVRHGLARTAVDWPYSTFHRYVRDEYYPSDWAGSVEAGKLDLE